MIDRAEAFDVLASCITDELVITGIGSQTASWFRAKHRLENLYLRGPMGLSVAVALGVATVHPRRRVVAIEGDGSMLMSLSSLASVGHRSPRNLIIVCMDNGIYEAGGRGPTVNAEKTSFCKIAEGLGITRTRSVDNSQDLRTEFNEGLKMSECLFLHVKIAPSSIPYKGPGLAAYEMKYHFLKSLSSSR